MNWGQVWGRFAVSFGVDLGAGRGQFGICFRLNLGSTWGPFCGRFRVRFRVDLGFGLKLIWGRFGVDSVLVRGPRGSHRRNLYSFAAWEACKRRWRTARRSRVRILRMSIRTLVADSANEEFAHSNSMQVHCGWLLAERLRSTQVSKLVQSRGRPPDAPHRRK